MLRLYWVQYTLDKDTFKEHIVSTDVQHIRLALLREAKKDNKMLVIQQIRDHGPTRIVTNPRLLHQILSGVEKL
jgi:hypothetical protein